MAVATPVLLLLTLGMIETGRALMVSEVMSHAARHGARTASITTGTTGETKQVVTDSLSVAGVRGATVSVTVNGREGEVASAVAGDQIGVSVSVPYDDVSWVSGMQFLKGKTLSTQTVFRRE